MLANIVKKAHLIVIVYALWSAWGIWMGYAEGVDGIKNDIATLKMSVKKLKKRKKEVRKYLKDIETAKEKIKLVEKEVDLIRKKLPEKIYDSENMDKVRKIADDLNFKKISLAPKIEESRGFYYAKGYDLTSTGTYLQFLVLFEQLANTERIFNVTELEIVRSKESQRGRFQYVNGKVVIESYRYNPKFSSGSSSKKSTSKKQRGNKA